MNKRHWMAATVVLLFVIAAGTVYICRDSIGGMIGYSRAAISYYGSTGQEVKNIQFRLRSWGYYKGAVDGVYGYRTYQAVRYFQSKNGLKVDGVAGSKTLAALGLPSGKRVSSGGAATTNEVRLLAHLIHGEARGESYVGQVAVAAVVLNRTKDTRFPKTIAGVIYQPGAFDAVSDGQINLAANETAYRAARDAMSGWDPSGGAVYYFNPATATSKWIWSRTIIAKIGKHWFAK